jgi:hypothetical protein
MIKNSQTEIDYNDIDFEIRDLCKAINEIDGIETLSSCCGHGIKPCAIRFQIEDISVLNRLLYFCFNHEHKWKIYADMSDPILNSNTLILFLTTDDVCDEYFVGIMVENLKNRLKKYF